MTHLRLLHDIQYCEYSVDLSLKFIFFFQKEKKSYQHQKSINHTTIYSQILTTIYFKKNKLCCSTTVCGLTNVVIECLNPHRVTWSCFLSSSLSADQSRTTVNSSFLFQTETPDGTRFQQLMFELSMMELHCNQPEHGCFWWNRPRWINETMRTIFSRALDVDWNGSAPLFVHSTKIDWTYICK